MLNVLFICIEDLHPALGCYGDLVAQTPHVDALAETGLVFDRAYCQQALCAPSRVSVLTGRRPDTTRVYGFDRHFRNALPDVETLPQCFKRRGFHTLSFGKIFHNYPLMRDPDSWSAPETLLDVVKRDEYLRPENRVGGLRFPMRKMAATEAVDAPDSAYADGQVADAAIEALESLHRRSFFIGVGFKRPHLPFSSPQQYWNLHNPADLVPPSQEPPARMPSVAVDDMSELREYRDVPDNGPLSDAIQLRLRHGYYAAVSYIDAQVGRLLNAVDSLDLRSNTQIVLWTDHGYHLGEHGLWGKKTNFEGAVHVPLILSGPDVPTGRRTKALVELVDIYPTLTGMCGLPTPDSLEGFSMEPVVDDPDRPWKQAAFSQYPRNRHVMGYTVRTDRFRYTEWQDRDTGAIRAQELYDLGATDVERENLSEHPAAQEETRRLSRLIREGWPAALPDDYTAETEISEN